MEAVAVPAAESEFVFAEFIAHTCAGLRACLAMDPAEAKEKLVAITSDRNLPRLRSMFAHSLVTMALAILGGLDPRALDTDAAWKILSHAASILGRTSHGATKEAKEVLSALLPVYIDCHLRAGDRRPASFVDLLQHHVDRLGVQKPVLDKVCTNIRAHFDGMVRNGTVTEDKRGLVPEAANAATRPVGTKRGPPSRSPSPRRAPSYSPGPQTARAGPSGDVEPIWSPRFGFYYNGADFYGNETGFDEAGLFKNLAELEAEFGVLPGGRVSMSPVPETPVPVDTLPPVRLHVSPAALAPLAVPRQPLPAPVPIPNQQPLPAPVPIPTIPQETPAAPLPLPQETPAAPLPTIRVLPSARLAEDTELQTLAGMSFLANTALKYALLHRMPQN